MQDVIVEVVNGESSYLLPPVADTTALEVYVDPPMQVEVPTQLPDTHYKIGGTDPTADPSILVWYKIP